MLQINLADAELLNLSASEAGIRREHRAVECSFPILIRCRDLREMAKFIPRECATDIARLGF